MRRLIIIGVAFAFAVGFTPAATAQGQGGQEAEPFVVLSGPADVPAGRQVGDLVVFHGSSIVDGTVDGSLTAFDAPVTISGRVVGDVVVFNGRVELRGGAEVTGDVVSQSDPVVAPGARIGGTTKRVQTSVDRWELEWAGRIAFWIAVSVSTLVLGLLLIWLLGAGAGRVVQAARTAIAAAIGWGLLAFLGLPILAVIALVTVVGLPLGLVVLAALGLIYTIGYTATAFILGRQIVRQSTPWALAFLVGWAILRLLALIPIVGGLIWFVAVVFGLGALTVVMLRSRAGRQPVPA
jgi:hypothetical protein